MEHNCYRSINTNFLSKIDCSIRISILFVLSLCFPLFKPIQTPISSPFNISQSFYSQIYGSCYGKNGQHLYLSVKDIRTGLNLIKKYNITQLTSNSSAAALTSFTPSQQVYVYNQLLQLNETHLVSYSTTNPVYQIFYLNGSCYSAITTSNQISQIIFSVLRQQIYIIYFGGSYQLHTLLYFLNVSGSKYVFGSYSDDIIGYLSPDQNYLAISSVYQIHFIDLNQRKEFLNKGYQYIDRLVWNSNSQSVYSLNAQINALNQKSIVSPYLQKSYSLSSYNLPSCRFISQMVHINQTNEIIFMIQNGSSSLSISNYLISFNLSSNSAYSSIAYQANSFLTVQKIAFYQLPSNSIIQYLIQFTSTVNYYNVGYISIINNNSSNYTNGTTNTSTLNNNTLLTNNTGTNSTVNNNNVTNLTNATNLTNFSSNQGNIKYLDIQGVTTYESMIHALFQSPLFLILNKIPGGRKYLKPIFSFFINFDDLQLYIYHQKSYNPAILSLFYSIRKFEYQKWQIINYKYIWQDWLKLNVVKLEYFLNNTSKLNYTSKKYKQIQAQSNGYFLNTLNFYGSNLILIFFTFLIGKFFFFIFSYLDFKLKYIFSKFRFKSYFIMIALQSNIQFMAYLFGFQLKTLFHVNFSEKTMQIMVLIINFFIIFLIISIFFLISSIISKKTIQIFQNLGDRSNGSIYLTLQWSLRNFILGLAHIMLEDDEYAIKIGCIIIIETIFMFVNIYFTTYSTNKGFSRKSSVWITIITTFIRILLFGSLLLNFQQRTDSQYQVQIILTIAILVNYMALWICSMLNQFFYTLQENITHLKHKLLLKRQEKNLKISTKVEKAGILHDIALQNKYRKNLQQLFFEVQNVTIGKKVNRYSQIEINFNKELKQHVQKNYNVVSEQNQISLKNKKQCKKRKLKLKIINRIEQKNTLQILSVN